MWNWSDRIYGRVDSDNRASDVCLFVRLSVSLTSVNLETPTIQSDDGGTEEASLELMADLFCFMISYGNNLA